MAVDEVSAAITRVNVFHDSMELARLLKGNDDYLSQECAVHIAGLWKLTQTLAKLLKERANG